MGGPNNNDGYRAKLKALFASDTAPDVFYLEWFVYPPPSTSPRSRRRCSSWGTW